MKSLPQIEVARLLIVGFVQCKSMGWLLTMLDYTRDDDLTEIGKRYPFLAGSLPWDWFGRKNGRSPLIRTHVANMWPRLFTYLDAHTHDPAKLLAAADQVLKLRWKAKRQSVLTEESRAEARRVRRAYAARARMVRATGELYESHSRSAWSVVKGPNRGSR